MKNSEKTTSGPLICTFSKNFEQKLAIFDNFLEFCGVMEVVDDFVQKSAVSPHICTILWNFEQKLAIFDRFVDFSVEFYGGGAGSRNFIKKRHLSPLYAFLVEILYKKWGFLINLGVICVLIWDLGGDLGGVKVGQVWGLEFDQKNIQLPPHICKSVSIFERFLGFFELLVVDFVSIFGVLSIFQLWIQLWMPTRFLDRKILKKHATSPLNCILCWNFRRKLANFEWLADLVDEIWWDFLKIY